MKKKSFERDFCGLVTKFYSSPNKVDCQYEHMHKDHHGQTLQFQHFKIVRLKLHDIVSENFDNPANSTYLYSGGRAGNLLENDT